MTIHKEGYTSIALTILFIFVLNAVIQFYYPQAYTLKWIIYIFSALLFLIILQFFRSPHFKITAEESQVLCPADGKVVVIEETEETEYLKDKRIQISVFMSPVNVHVNRNPITGVVKYFKYHPGKYLVAWHPKSSTQNERTTIVTENSAGVAVLFRQIAGAMARRIVWYVKEGDEVKQGEQFGFIKFGSRVDIFLPLGTDIKVAIGEVVKGGKTILAELSSSAPAAKADEAVKVATPKPAGQTVIAATDVPVKPVTIAAPEPKHAVHHTPKDKEPAKPAPKTAAKPASKPPGKKADK